MMKFYAGDLHGIVVFGWHACGFPRPHHVSCGFREMPIVSDEREGGDRFLPFLFGQRVGESRGIVVDVDCIK